MKSITFRLQIELNEALDGFVDAGGYNKSAVLRIAVKEFLKQREVI